MSVSDESPKSSLSCPVVSATVVIDQLDGQGSVLRSARHPTASLSLCRNEHRDLALRLDTANGHQLKVFLQDVTLHRRFLREGKATVVVRGQSLRLLISNAPPAQLLTFLRVLSAKLALQAAARPVCVRERLALSAARRLDEISPLTAEQLSKLQPQQQKQQQLNKLQPQQQQRQGQGRGAPLTARDPNVPPAPRPTKRPAAATTQSQPKKPAKELTMSQYLNPLPITKEQRAVLEVATSNRNIFFTGGAGTGKSFLLQRIISALPPESTWVTASTGAAACQVQGVTLHSFAGLGRGGGSREQCVQLASRPGVLQQWRRCRHLVIDEISMVDADFFQKLEYVARMVRGSTAPFGGIHLVLCGDFLQLPPVVASAEKAGGGGRFCFESKAWARCIEVTMELRQIHRQDDTEFIRILQNVRMGRCSEEDARRLAGTASNRMELPAGIAATRLCTHRADVDQINEHKLAALTGREREYYAEDSAGAPASVLTALTPVPARLRLRPGAQVMLAKNLDVRVGLVNGARGVVVGFSGGTPFGGQMELPEVQFACGVRRLLTPERWTARSTGGGTLSRRQLPLRLAWAFSVHKSQGMTLDCVEMTLSRSFEPGQAYVALSRARNLRSLRVLDFTAACVRAHPAVLRFYSGLQSG